MIEDAPPAGEHRLLAKVDILEGLPQAEVDYVATHSETIRLGRREASLRARTRGVSSYC
jgi:hypothetical protein